MLPLVRRIVADIQMLTEAIDVQREQIEGIDAIPHTMEQADYQDELLDIRGSIADDEQRLEDCLGELKSLGIEPHFPFDGSIDFPAVVNRQSIQLCWRPEDERVEYYHEPGQPPAQRRKIDPQAFGAEMLN